jgi:Ser/Thr protein kinase RdoA (MazF antagonist)
MAEVHVRLGRFRGKTTRALAATWAPPGSLRRWSAVTEAALSGTTAGGEAAQRLHALVNFVRRDWTRPANLPCQVLHGDFRLGNACTTDDADTLVLDFGFADARPRVHDIAYSMAFMMLGLGEDMWDISRMSPMIESYNLGAEVSLSVQEMRAIPAHVVAVLLHAIAHDGFTADPLAQLSRRFPFLDLAEWITGHSGEFKIHI